MELFLVSVFNLIEVLLKNYFPKGTVIPMKWKHLWGTAWWLNSFFLCNANYFYEEDTNRKLVLSSFRHKTRKMGLSDEQTFSSNMLRLHVFITDHCLSEVRLTKVLKDIKNETFWNITLPMQICEFQPHDYANPGVVYFH